MAALASNRANVSSPQIFKTVRGRVKGSVHIYKNAVIAIVDGLWRPVTATTGLEGKYALAQEEVDNTTGGDGDAYVNVEFFEPKVMFLLKNDATAPITNGEIGGSGYALDDQTVSADDDSAARSLLGTPWMFFEANRKTVTTSVWVEVK